MDLFQAIAEQGVVTGAFVFLLYYILNKQEKLLQELGSTLKEISRTLTSFDSRLSELEKGKKEAPTRDE